jgi:YVTN family beta-propeller protein
VQEQIGRGGMGVVYRATHLHLGREVALKLLAPQYSDARDFRERFLRESRMAASLEHPNIVTVYDAGDLDGTLFIAMRYVRGPDLAKLLREHGPVSPQTALSMLDQVGGALDAAHRLGLVHRDVKPANVLFDAGHCYLTDFGLSKRAGVSEASAALTRTGVFLGTIDYVAPEQIQGGAIDGRTDIYALTCMLHECLTASRPFPKDSELAVINGHLNEPPPRPSKLRPDLPAAIDGVVATGMAKSPGDRYPTCLQLTAAARAALQGVWAETVTDTPQYSEISSVVAHSPAPTSVVSAVQPSLTASNPGGTGPDAAPRRTRSPRVLGSVAALCAAAIVAVVILTSGSSAAKHPHTTKTVLGPATHRGAEASTSGKGQGSATQSGSGSQTTGTAPAARVVGTPIQVGKDPVGIAGPSRLLWIANFGASTVSRVTPTGAVRTDIVVPPGPIAVLDVGTTFWVASAQAGLVTPISVATGLPGKPVHVGNRPSWLAGDEDGVFVSNVASDTVSVINPRTDSLIGAAIKVGFVPRGIAAGGTAVWVADSDSDNIDRIVDGQVIKTIRVGRRPIGVAVGDNAVWVANEDDNTVSRINLANDSVKEIKVGKAPFAIAFGLGSAWVTNSGDNTVTRLDGATGEPVGRPIPVGKDPTGITVIPNTNSVWVTNRGSGTAMRIQP